MALLLVLGFFVVIAAGHNITLLEVPTYGDPRREAQLTCHYINEKGDPPLHSVKWYRENNEIFRYTPGQQPSTRMFNTSIGLVTNGSCHMQSCTISVVLPKMYNTRISYTCEVSTEGPRFAVVKQTKHLTVAVALKEDPRIMGTPGSVQPGEDIFLNCSTTPAMPPANIVWYIDGKPDESEPWLDHTKISSPDDSGLRSSWRSIKLRAPSAQSMVSLRCEATQPTRPLYTRAAEVSVIIARSPHLSMFTAYGSSPTTRISDGVMLFSICVSVYVLSKFSALSEY